jgi:hypothetical protein
MNRIEVIVFLETHPESHIYKVTIIKNAKKFIRDVKNLMQVYLAVYVQLESSKLFLNNLIKIILPLYFLTCIILALLQNLMRHKIIQAFFLTIFNS